MKKGLTSKGWDVMCNVSEIVIDVDGRMGHLYLPKHNAPDMVSTINCFTSADPECSRIHTYVDGVPDTMYIKQEGVWHAEYPEKAHDGETEHEYQAAVDKVLAEHPGLTQAGFGDSGEIRPEAVQHCVNWLLKHDAFERRKTINGKASSYYWKHVVERDCGEYIANGEFICAALYLGYKMRRDTINAYFNIRDVEKQ
jgi:hypothetical protein